MTDRIGGMAPIGPIFKAPPEAWPDSTRPNFDGGADPLVLVDNEWTLIAPVDFAAWPTWPVYRVRKVCPTHGLFVGVNLRPQYDDEEARRCPCEHCMNREDELRAARLRKWAAESQARQRPATGQRSRRPRDPLSDL